MLLYFLNFWILSIYYYFIITNMKDQHLYYFLKNNFLFVSSQAIKSFVATQNWVLWCRVSRAGPRRGSSSYKVIGTLNKAGMSETNLWRVPFPVIFACEARAMGTAALWNQEYKVTFILTALQQRAAWLCHAWRSSSRHTSITVHGTHVSSRFRTCSTVDTLGWVTKCVAGGAAGGMAAEVVGGDDTSFGFWILRNDYDTCRL